MEEKRNEELAIIEQVIKLGGSLPMEAWIAAILAKTAATEKSLNELAHFDSRIEKVEFRRLVDNLRFCDSDTEYVFVSCIHYGDDGVTITLRLGNPDSSFYLVGELGLKRFLLAHGFGWEETARKIWEQLERALPVISKIRRNILYPEVAEMEKEIGELKKKLEVTEVNLTTTDCRLKLHEKLLEDERTRLAEKEKEIGELKKELELLIGRISRAAFRIGAWIENLGGIVFRLVRTRTIFKSKAIADIRFTLEDIIRIIREERNDLEKIRDEHPYSPWKGEPRSRPEPKPLSSFPPKDKF